MSSLWNLCWEGKLNEVRTTLARGKDVNRKYGQFSQTGLMAAVKNRQNSIVRLLLEQPTVDLNCTDFFSQTALHHAARSDNAEAVQLLLNDPRLNANYKDTIGYTPVMFAMRHGKVVALRELAAHPSVDLDTRNRAGRSLEKAAR